MLKHLHGFSIILFITFSVNKISFAQDNCASSLSSAQDNYDSGHLYGIPAILKPCLDDGFSREEKIQAYRLLTRTYLIIDDPISAENSYLNLLDLDPEYKIDEENDPIELVHLSKKFKTTPIFTWTYGKIGFNTTSISIINTYTTGNKNSNSILYSGSIGYQASSSLEMNITDQWSLNGELMLANRSFTYSNTLFTEDKQAFKENQNWIELPFYVKYRRQFNKFQPYIYGGYVIQYLLSAELGADPNGNGQLVNIDPAQTDEGTASEQASSGPKINISDSRARFTQSVVAGLGVRYRIGYHYLMFETRYNLGLKNMLNQENQYTKSGDNYSNELQFRYGYVDSDFRINNLSFSIGVVKPIYKPRKIDARAPLLQRLLNKKGGVKK